MSSIRVTKDDLIHGFREIGIERGDVLYVASSLAALGLMANPVQDTLAALREAVGPEGTLVMPVFNFDFCEGKGFDREHTPSRAGLLSEAFRQWPSVQRTWSPPFHTVAASGPRAKDIAAIESLTSFGRDSVFQYLHDIGAKHLLLGCGFHEGVAHVHWLEEINEAPYRHWKRFEGEVVRNGQRQQRSFFMFARDPKHTLDAEPLGRDFAEAGLMRQTDVGFCRLRAFTLRDFKEFLGPRFATNPLCLLKPEQHAPYAARTSPVKRIDHIGIVSRYSDKIRDFLGGLRCQLSAEGVVPELGVNCQYFDGLDVTLEFVEPLRDDSRVSRHLEQFPACPLHHIAFEVSDMGDAVQFFKARGYEPLDGRHYFGPKRWQRVTFLSPVQTGGLLVELVCDDGDKFKTYGGLQA